MKRYPSSYLFGIAIKFKKVCGTVLSGGIVQRAICVDLILSHPRRANALDVPLTLKSEFDYPPGTYTHIYCCEYLYRSMTVF